MMIDTVTHPLYHTRGWTGHLWAQPVVSHLKELLKYLHWHKEEAREVGKRARESMLARFQLQIMGEVVGSHVDRILRSL